MRPKVIFLDAAGTLFGVRGSVGEVYGRLASRFGVEVSAEALNRAFFESFKASVPACFPGVEPVEIPQREFQWWRTVARSTFERAGVLNQFSNFDSFFAELYAHFATAEPWFVYPDVRPALQRWHQQGIELGVLSNFDSRLRPVLRALDLADFFTSVTVSTEVGAAKPDAQIFAAALQKHDCSAEAALHIGDSYKEDWEGATRAGLRGIWLNRDVCRRVQGPGEEGGHSASQLLELAF
jgi:putative hydrolase of the HAD superfamily